MSSNVYKELFIIGLLVVVVIFTLALLFYDTLGVDAKKIDSIEDISEEKVNMVMSDIGLGKDDSTIEKYNRKITQEEIDKYFEENSYNTGKKNPFAEKSDTKTEGDASKDKFNTVFTDPSNTKEISTGRFFEEKDVK